MRTYSAELKDGLMAKMLAPDNISVPQLVRETDFPRDTLYGWRRQAVDRGAAPAVSATLAGALEQRGEEFAAVVDRAAGANARHWPILGDLAAYHQIRDLATFGQFLDRDPRQQVAPALAAASRRDDDGVLGCVDQGTCGARVVLLAPRFRPAGLAQRARRQLFEGRARAGWLARVVAVLGQTQLLYLDPLKWFSDLRRLLRHLRADEAPPLQGSRGNRMRAFPQAYLKGKRPTDCLLMGTWIVTGNADSNQGRL